MAWTNIIGQYLVLLCLVSAEISVEVVKNYRLPKTVVPINYILRININDIYSNSFTGSVVMNFQTTEASKYILLHASPAYLNLTKIILNGDNDKLCNVTNADSNTEIITITCMENTTVKKSNSLVINYEALFTSVGEFGLYKINCERNGSVECILATQLAPSYARRVFPCLDEPEFKAAFDIFITIPNTVQVLGNTPTLFVANESDRLTAVEFVSTPPMPTYLVGFIISKLEPGNENAIYKVYTTPELKKYTGTASTYTPDLVKVMDEWTGVKYEEMKNTQLHQVALEYSKFPSMENWGLIIYREKYLLDDADKTTELAKQKIISNMAHAISQQWFGAYVTLDWWSNAWLNEGFATFFEYYLPDQIPGLNFETGKQFTVNVLQLALGEDAFPDTAPLSSKEEDVMTPDDCLDKFNVITSAKGASLIRMMKGVKGEEQFQEGLKSYLAANKFNTTDPKSLLESLNLSNLMENWIYEPGYPLLTVEHNTKKPEVAVTQEKYKLLKNDTDKETNWNVPVTFATSEDKSFNLNNIVWLENGKKLVIDLKEDSWIILNVQQMGFYRVNYDETLWNRIIQALKGNDRKNIHVLNRAQLIDDAFNIARVGKVSYSTFFSLADYLKDETEYYPWVSALNAMSYLEEHIVDLETRKLLNVKISQWIDSAFPNLIKIEATDHIDILRETLILKWKCELQHDDCLEYAATNFETYKKSNGIMNREERDIIFCYGMKISERPQVDYNFMLNTFQDTNSTSERENILSSLGCITNTNILSDYLLEIVAERSVIPQSYAVSIFKAVYSNNDIGVDVALDFFEQNIQQLMEKFEGVFSISDFIIGLADRIKTRAQLEKLEKIIADNPHVDDLPLVGNLMIRKIKYNLDWSETYTEAIKSALPETSSGTAVHSNCLLFVIVFSAWCIHLY